MVTEWSGLINSESTVGLQDGKIAGLPSLPDSEYSKKPRSVGIRKKVEGPER